MSITKGFKTLLLTKNCFQAMASTWLKTFLNFGLGFTPYPTGGVYSADPVADLEGTYPSKNPNPSRPFELHSLAFEPRHSCGAPQCCRWIGAYASGSQVGHTSKAKKIVISGIFKLYVKLNRKFTVKDDINT